MSKKRLDICWDRQAGKEDIKPALKRFDRYLEENGIRASTRSSYVFRVGKFLEFAGNDTPQEGEFIRFKDTPASFGYSSSSSITERSTMD
jgi:hypothetical protein